MLDCIRRWLTTPERAFTRHPRGEVALTDLTVSPRLLRFSRPVSARYEIDTRRERARHLRRTILIGLAFHNGFSLTTWLLAPEILPLALGLRLGLVTPLILLLAWAVPRMPGPRRERMVTATMLLVTGVPILLFCLGQGTLSAIAFVEYPLMVVFAALMLVLRFPHALVLTGLSAAGALAAIGLRGDLSPELALCLAFQAVTASVFVLYGNHQIEGVRRRAYLVSLREILRSAGLEHDRRVLTVLSETDALTGLANRRALDTALAASAGETRGTALLMIDVDHFKRFNDAYGHPAGDACLRRIAEALAGQTRGGRDVVARYGGEEFSLLMRACDRRGVERVVRRMNLAIARLAIPHADRGDGLSRITVSVGVALTGPGRGAGPDELLAEADAALYEAKRRGRNTHVIRQIGEGDLSARERPPGRLTVLRRPAARTAPPKVVPLRNPETNTALAR
ncbi:GGDEF domain-containing protein [Methylobacterium goesingense]|uniref:diguanylate cyclase n=1 Tax=Methylobacterium goesingense TaxID=243690 RepID=A0ABV2L8E9_9HYPH|nr:GGDEF domain-containing protein [Methylobacterium goesingense]GJD73418.1 hypothetical protein CFIICLFH_1645 [Methylobacterium goesingense]